MGKLIYRGLSKTGAILSSQPFAITGANLRKSQKKTAKARAGTRAKLQEPQKEEGD
jgi:hypothetical protein